MQRGERVAGTGVSTTVWAPGGLAGGPAGGLLDVRHRGLVVIRSVLPVSVLVPFWQAGYPSAGGASAAVSPRRAAYRFARESQPRLTAVFRRTCSPGLGNRATRPRLVGQLGRSVFGVSSFSGAMLPSGESSAPALALAPPRLEAPDKRSDRHSNHVRPRLEARTCGLRRARRRDHPGDVPDSRRRAPRKLSSKNAGGTERSAHMGDRSVSAEPITSRGGRRHRPRRRTCGEAAAGVAGPSGRRREGPACRLPGRSSPAISAA